MRQRANCARTSCGVGKEAARRAAPGRGPVEPNGFTLVEILIAIGLLGVGLLMAACLFPAGVQANVHSADDLLGTLICQNGLALAKARLNTTDVTSPYYTDLSPIFAPADLLYPHGSDEGEGFFVLGCNASPTDPASNDYQFTVIAYQKHRDGGAVLLKTAVGTAMPGKGKDADTGRFLFKNGSESVAQVGATMVVTEPGRTGRVRIVSIDGNEATLSRPLFQGSQQDIHVVIPYQQGLSIDPVIGAMTARTSLPIR